MGMIKRWAAIAATGLAISGSVLLATPAQAATGTATGSHAVNVIHERATVGKQHYALNFTVKRLAKVGKYGDNTYCALTLKNPKHRVLYTTRLTSGQCWAMHTIWTEREEPLTHRVFTSQHKLVQAVRGEVREAKAFAHELEF